MLKKIFITFLFILFVSSTFTCFNNVEAKPVVQSLKVEQDSKKAYTYGNLEKEFSKSDSKENENFANVLDEADKHEPSILKIFNSLIFVILLILLTGWVYMKIKKINPEQLLSGKFNKLGENNFKIISSLQLGAGKSIYLIEINNKQLIVGTTASSVNLLAQMDKQEDNAEIPKEYISKLFDNSTEEFKKLDE